MDQLEEKLKVAKTNGKLPKIVVAVHFSGEPCELKKLKNLSNLYNFKIIEDASHALGSCYKGSKTGSCDYSDVTIFSFHPVKIVTTAEGGSATTNCDKIKDRLDLLCSHGVTRDRRFFRERDHGDWYYEQIDLGYNFRMNEIQAALGISQLTKLNSFWKNVVKFVWNTIKA